MPLDTIPAKAFIKPDYGIHISKGLLASGSGAQQARELARAGFESHNRGVHYQQAILDHEDARYERLTRELRYAVRRRELEEPRTPLMTSETIKKIPLFYWFKSFLMLVGSLIGLFMGNQIGVKYIVASGHDLYATDPGGASFFMGVIMLGAIALKVVEGYITSGLGKKLFVAFILLMSLPGVVVWIFAFSLVFAPDATGGMARMVGDDRSGQQIMSVMICLHLLADLGLGYLCFAGAEKTLLAGNQPDAVDNPEYIYWSKREAELDTAIWLTRKTLAFSLDELEARHNALLSSEIEAELTHERIKSVVEEDARAAISAARASALKSTTPIS